MAKDLATLFRNLLHLREYRAARGYRLPWRIRLPYFRNLVRHDAINNWPGGYIVRTDGLLAYVPAHVDVTAGHRLFKPASKISQIEVFCKPGDYVLDIGANVGDWTLPFAERVGPSGRVLAFEPVPYLAETVSKTAMVNKHEWVEVHNVALGSEEGEAPFSVEYGNSGGSRLGRLSGNFAPISVHVARLDDVLARRPDIDRIDFIKIDVEGHELEVLRGARKTLSRFLPPLVLECGAEDNNARVAMHDLLVDLGYEIVGAFVPGGIIEIGWQDFRDNKGEVGRLGLCNYLFMHVKAPISQRPASMA